MTDGRQWVTAVIPTGADPRGLGRCIRSLLAGSLVPRILAVADGTDETALAEELKNVTGPVTVYRTGRRTGRCHALNCGLHLVQTPAALVISPAATAGRRMTERLLGAMKDSGNCFAAQARIESREEPGRIESTGTLADAGSGVFRRDRGEYRRAHREGTVFAPDSRAALFNVRAMEDIGLFDERMCSIAADADLGWRAQRMGGVCLYVPGAAARIPDSLPEETSQTLSEEELLLGDSLYMMHKNMPALQYRLNGPARAGYLRSLRRQYAAVGREDVLEQALQRGRELCLLRETEEAEREAGASVTKRTLTREAGLETDDTADDMAEGMAAARDMAAAPVYPLYVGTSIPTVAAEMPVLLSLQAQLLRNGRHRTERDGAQAGPEGKRIKEWKH